MAEITRRSMLALGLMGSSSLLPALGATGGNPILGKGGVHHIAIRTRDWNRTLSFYQQALGFHVKMAWKEGSGSVDEKIAANSANQENDRWAYLDSGDGTCVEIFEDLTFVVPPTNDDFGPTKNPGGGIVHFGLRTSRIDAVCKNAAAHGASNVGVPADFTLHTTTGQGPVVVRIAFIQGPSGEWIELLQGAP